MKPIRKLTKEEIEKMHIEGEKYFNRLLDMGEIKGVFFKMNKVEIEIFKKIIRRYPQPHEKFLTNRFNEKGKIEFYPLKIKVQNEIQDKISNCYYIFDRANFPIFERAKNTLKITNDSGYHYFGKNIHEAYLNFKKALKIRIKLVSQFKNGMNTSLMLNLFLMAFGKDFFKDKIVIPIAASDKKENDKRYSQFMKELCDVAECKNGMNLINIKTKKSKHKGGMKLRKEDFIVTNDISKKIKDKNIILIDDVYTTGSTSYLWGEKLFEFNPNKIQYVFLSKQLSTLKIFKEGEIVRIFNPEKHHLINSSKLYYVKSYNSEKNLVKICIGKKGSKFMYIDIPDSFVIKIIGDSKCANESPPKPSIEKMYEF